MYHIIFNKIIMYNPEEGTLYHVNNPENVKKLHYQQIDAYSCWLNTILIPCYKGFSFKMYER